MKTMLRVVLSLTDAPTEAEVAAILQEAADAGEEEAYLEPWLEIEFQTVGPDPTFPDPGLREGLHTAFAGVLNAAHEDFKARFGKAGGLILPEDPEIAVVKQLPPGLNGHKG